MQKLTSTYKVDSFESSDKDFTDYLHVNSFSDQNLNIGQTWLYVYNEKIILGYITLAMAHMTQKEHKKLEVDGFGNIPGLIIGQIATNKEYECSGVATKMINWAINEANNYSKHVGCKIVMLNPKDDEKIREFYRKRGFVYVHHDDKNLDSMFVLLDWLQ